MKKIVISIRPEWAREILNRKKTIEIRRGLSLYNALKKAEEKGEEVEFLMYVTKAKPCLAEIYDYDHDGSCNETVYAIAGPNISESEIKNEYGEPLNGKIVAWFKPKAEVIKYHNHRNLDDWCGYFIDRGEKIGIGEIELCESSCLKRRELDDYLQEKQGTALNIEDPRIFDAPKTLADYGLKRAPQSWCYTQKAK